MRKTGKLTSVMMALLLVLQLVFMAVGTSVSAETAETVVVCADTAYVPLEGEKVFTTLSAAINYLGTDGGIIYIKGEIVSAGGSGGPTDCEGTISERGEVIIRGYGNTASGNTLSFGSAYLSGKWLNVYKRLS